MPDRPAEALGFTYVNGTAIVDAIDPDVATSLQAMMPEMDPQAWLTHSGSTISADTPGFRFDSITIPGEGGSLAGLSAANDPAVAAAAERAPADSFIFQAGVLHQDALLGLPYALSTMVNEAAQTTDAAASM